MLIRGSVLAAAASAVGRACWVLWLLEEWESVGCSGRKLVWIKRRNIRMREVDLGDGGKVEVGGFERF